MLLAGFMLSMQGLIAALAMASTMPSPQLAHQDCHGQFEAGPSQAVSHEEADPVVHTADAVPAKDTPAHTENGQKPACCTPVGVAVLPHLECFARLAALQGDKLAMIQEQVPAGHLPEGPRKPPRTSDQV